MLLLLRFGKLLKRCDDWHSKFDSQEAEWAPVDCASTLGFGHQHEMVSVDAMSCLVDQTYLESPVPRPRHISQGKSFKCCLDHNLQFQNLAVHSELHEYRSSNSENNFIWSSNNTIPILQLTKCRPADAHPSQTASHKYPTASTPYGSATYVYKPQVTPT